MNIINELRTNLKMTQDEFAEYCGIAKVSIARYEAGANISRSNAKKIAAACGVTIGYVIGEEEKPAQGVIDNNLLDLLVSLSPDEVQRVQDFVAGIKANRKS